MANYWGYHLMLDCAGADHASITDSANIAAFTKELVKRIDMVAYGEPQIVNFGTGNKAGYTLVQLIETSNICAHFCNDTDTFYLDVFSCKTFDKDVVVQTVREFFHTNSERELFITRQA
jgi:S-adenosylmethionine/arginine decarboxylase-like enzyme